MAMKLVFPGSDRGQLLLEMRTYTIGTDPASDVVVDGVGNAPLHCELTVSAQGVQLRIPDGNPVDVNDRPVTALMALRPGDTLACGNTRIRLVKVADVVETSAASQVHGLTGATMVRPVLPKFVLRGMSGEQFGRSYPLQASMVVGRAEDASLCLPLESISRQHARLTPAGDEVLVEDLGSANGTWINGTRISRGQARHGDEIRFDTQRFQLVVPGQVVAHRDSPSTDTGRRGILLVAALLASAGAVALFLMRG